MRRLPRYRSASSLLLGAALLITVNDRPARAADSAAAKPNILIIVADDLGYGDLGFQGGKEIPTPHLDSLAAGGVRFTSGYVSCPVCSPTRAGLSTGRYQQRFGHEFNPGQAIAEDGVTVGLPLSETTLASALKQAGYTTANIGKWHLGAAEGYRPLDRGFDEFYGFLGGAHPYIPGATHGRAARRNAQAQGQQPGQGAAEARDPEQRQRRRQQQLAANDPNAGGAGQPIYRNNEPTEFPPHLTQAFGDEAAAYIKREKDKPFFLYLTFNAVHNPLQPDPEHEARFANIADPKRRAYAGLLSGLDDAVGTVLDALRTSGQEENTLVFFISDNGGPQQGNGSNNAPLSGDKGTVWEGGIRVPYVVQWKGKLPAGATFAEPVISLDVTATAAAAAGATLGGPDRPVDGVDLLPFALGNSQGAPHEALYWRFGPQRAIRRGNYKLLQIGDQPPQLYDVAADVAEKHDLAAEHPKVVAELDGLYASWNSQLAEPLWKRNQGGGRRNAVQRAERRAAREALAVQTDAVK